MANIAAPHLACHSPACTCGAGARTQHRCRCSTDALEARLDASATACATERQKKAWYLQISGVNGPSAGGIQLHGHLHVGAKGPRYVCCHGKAPATFHAGLLHVGRRLVKFHLHQGCVAFVRRSGSDKLPVSASDAQVMPKHQRAGADRTLRPSARINDDAFGWCVRRHRVSSTCASACY
eukprot:361988-Chlamydomonas_euryale.AAC.10